MILLVSLYETGQLQRDLELYECYKRNFVNPFITDICIIFEGTIGDLHEKVKLNVQHYVQKRPTYDTFLGIANSKYRGEIVIIANADIYFDESIRHILDVDLTNKLVMLTRYNKKGNIEGFQTHEEYTASADAWIMASPVRFECNCMLGVPYCDGKISLYAHNAGYEVVNYSKDIKIVHLHNPDYVNNKRSHRIYKGESLYTRISKIGEDLPYKPIIKND